ncbi:hypothetical protein DSM104443_01586 [Usitatibacter rugosus]|uniref:SPOR domain-containing protein n=1 Tax=Usitatibacter rugosus TaxID=2732067 RepID=A0A6M4GU24_9PROT|nr:SPOR domain-containing protein [Usitatibacter rugosus]QJR10522.1 hypothetical protein DSM104443_01586 [Usitatibacter rugosus]
MATSTPDTSEIRRRGRQRLIGAITIVLLLVVFVPMLLDPEPRQDRKEPAAVAIPSKDNAPALPAPSVAPVKTGAQPDPATIPPRPQLADATKSSTPPKAPEGPKVVAPPAEPKADLSQVIAAKTAETAPAPVVAPVKTGAQPGPAKGPVLEGFAVQVGAFRDDEKLKQAREKLAAAKITHFTEHLAGSDLTRLRAGPYKTREAADKAAAAIKTAGLDGKVVPLP